MVSAIAGRGGSISPAGAVEVADGGSVTFTITPDEGFAVAQLLVDGEAVEASGSYTFSALASDHTIYVTFLPSEPPAEEPPASPPGDSPYPPGGTPVIPGEGPEEPGSTPPSGGDEPPLSGCDPQLGELIDWILGQAQGEP